MFALGTLLSLSTVASAFAAAPNGAPAWKMPDPDIEVIVVTGKRPAVHSVEAVTDELVVTAKRAAKKAAERTPPVTPIEIPKVELAVAAPSAIGP